VARTVLDLADVVGPRELERAIDQAERRRIFNGRDVHDVLHHAAGRRGKPVLEGILDAYEEGPLTQEEIERRCLEVCEGAGLPRPRTQAAIEFAEGDTIYADFLWPDHHLIVETDGRETHATRQAFESDRRRDRRLLLLGYRVVRFTWRDVSLRPDDVASTLSALLAPANGCP
jgi:hypothetical protein